MLRDTQLRNQWQRVARARREARRAEPSVAAPAVAEPAGSVSERVTDEGECVGQEGEDSMPLS